jgi:hypothetical protein
VIDKASEIRHIKGRLPFWSHKPDKNGKLGNTSDLPHSLIIYRPRSLIRRTHQFSWDWKKSYKETLGPLPIRSKKTKEIIRYEEAA